MGAGPAEYRAIQDQIRRHQLAIGEMAAEIGREAESLRQLAEQAAAIAARHSLSCEAVIHAATNQRGSTSPGPIALLVEQLADWPQPKSWPVSGTKTLRPKSGSDRFPRPAFRREMAPERAAVRGLHYVVCLTHRTEGNTHVDPLRGRANYRGRGHAIECEPLRSHTSGDLFLR